MCCKTKISRSNPPMYKVLDKDTIEMEIIPHIPAPKRGFSPTVPLPEIINCILYKLKSGVQWPLLPVESQFSKKVLHYKTVFGHYRNWCKKGVWKKCWIHLLSKNRSGIDLSSGDLDGSHTTALRGGEAVAYQGRKKRKTTNSLYLSERQGLPLAMSTPVAGNHNDLYEIEQSLEEITDILKSANISTEGLFINADAGFDSENLLSACVAKGIIANVAYNKRNGNEPNRILDEELYKERYAIERMNAWMDSFRSVLNRFDTTRSSWEGFNFLAFIVLGIKKFTKISSKIKNG